MALGTRLGPYEVTAQIGQGGMGEVYRARDRKLQRDVAIKVLPEAFAHDTERLSRFEREARTLASLNHPNIAAIYGLEEGPAEAGHYVRGRPVCALVMELVEGETLAARIAKGPVPVPETMAIAKQIAEALEAAHEHGIIHRDLKPANIKVRPDGVVKVLDFGLAKALEPSGSSSVSQMTTVTSPAITELGMILGTAAYMSPEQARGTTVDEQTDIWSFGCVLYEMLTGTAAFNAGDVSETLAGVLRGDIDWSLLPKELSPVLRAFLMRCLYRDPKQRVHDMADLRLALEGAFGAALSQATLPHEHAWPIRGRSFMVAAAAVTAVVAGLAMWSRNPPVDVPRVTRLQMPLPAGQDFYFNGRHILAISPSGTQVAFTAGPGLWLRSLDELEARQVPGTEIEGRTPFFSPDGQSIGFYAAGQLRRVSVTGGAPVTLAKILNPWGASWSDSGMIYYGQGPEGIWRIPAQGGAPERIIAVGEGELAHGPQLLPGGEWMLFTLRPRGVGSWNRAHIVLQSLATGERVVLIEGGRDARYLLTGHLIYGLNGSILAVPFDVRARRLTGGAVPVVRNVYDAGAITGAEHFGVATNGSLAYVPRFDTALRLTWVDRNGREQEIPTEPRPYRHPRVSPDGTLIAVEIDDPNDVDVWIGEGGRGAFTRLTRGDDVDSDPIWTRDGSHVVFSSARDTDGLFRQPADGSGAAEHVIDGAGGVRAVTWTLDGRLVYEELAGADIRVLSLSGGSAPQVIPLFDAPEYFYERLPALSPDGRWLAYQSTESGEMEIYVRPFPKVMSGRWQISNGGGFAPLWSPDGREIFYRNASSIVAAQIQTEPVFKVVTSTPLFNLAGYVLAGQRGIRYDVGPDGRFLLLKGDSSDDSSRRNIVLVQNWFEELKRLVPTN